MRAFDDAAERWEEMAAASDGKSADRATQAARHAREAAGKARKQMEKESE